MEWEVSKHSVTPSTSGYFNFLFLNILIVCYDFFTLIWQVKAQHKYQSPLMANIGILADEATITGFLLAGAGCITSGNQKNFCVVDQSMSKADVEAVFEEMRDNPNISIVMVSNGVMETIKDTIAECDLRGKVIMPFPTKDSGLFTS